MAAVGAIKNIALPTPVGVIAKVVILSDDAANRSAQLIASEPCCLSTYAVARYKLRATCIDNF